MERQGRPMSNMPAGEVQSVPAPLPRQEISDSTKVLSDLTHLTSFPSPPPRVAPRRLVVSPVVDPGRCAESGGVSGHAARPQPECRAEGEMRGRT